MEWKLYHPDATPDHLGIIPAFLSESDPRPAREQFDENYAHGGGWRPMEGWTLEDGPAFDPPEIQYSGDPLYKAFAGTQLRDERIYIFPYAWVCIIQPDGSFEVSRMD